MAISLLKCICMHCIAEINMSHFNWDKCSLVDSSELSFRRLLVQIQVLLCSHFLRPLTCLLKECCIQGWPRILTSTSKQAVIWGKGGSFIVLYMLICIIYKYRHSFLYSTVYSDLQFVWAFKVNVQVKGKRSSLMYTHATDLFLFTLLASWTSLYRLWRNVVLLVMSLLSHNLFTCYWLIGLCYMVYLMPLKALSKPNMVLIKATGINGRSHWLLFNIGSVRW